MQLRVPIRIIAWCIMPNHWYLVLSPESDQDVSEYMRLVSITHVQRWHAFHKTSGTGALYQGRFKACAVEESEYLQTVLRYIEWNPLRANLAERADQWRWSSLRSRLGFSFTSSVNQPRLSLLPIALPRNWEEYVQLPQTEKERERFELARIRKSVETGLPCGEEDWLKRTVKLLGLESLISPKGRPKKKKESE
ncbi:MAG: transposase [Planctomycetia bacterium]|nr:transposase [Planctomycetia bacterium]